MIASRRPTPAVRHWRTLLASLALVTAAAEAQQQTAKLVKDANITRENLPAGIGWVARAGTGVVFPMDTLATGKELWVSDGTAKGTKLLKDIGSGPGSSNPQQGITFGTGAGTKAAFLTQDPAYVSDVANPPELALWVTDGTEAGTVRIFESAVPAQSGYTDIAAATPNGFFVKDSSLTTNGDELIFSDGTVAGTRVLNPLVSGARNFANPDNFTTSGQWCYFNGNGNEIWRSDGTVAGTTKVTTITTGTLYYSFAVGDTLYINVVIQNNVSSQIWVCPAAGGTATPLTPPAGNVWQWVLEMNSVGDELVFVIQDGTKQTLWATDGTQAGIRRIPLTLPGQSAESKMGFYLTKWQDVLYFSTTQENVGTGVWRTDGTTAGTTLLSNIKAPYGVLTDMWAGGDGLYFGRSTEKGYQLWKTQGTAKTTVALKGTPYIRSDAGMQNAPIVTATDSTVYFLYAQETPFEYLVRPKSAKGGTLQLTPRPELINGSGITPYPAGAPPYELTATGLLEFVNTGRGQELWQIDSKGKSKSLFRLSLPGTLGFQGNTANGPLFSRYVGVGSAEVFVVGGTKAKTISLSKDPTANGYEFMKAGDLWYFSPTYTGAAKSSPIWKTDGTVGGTAIVKTADGTTDANRIGGMVAYQGNLYFIATAPNNKRELWRTNGTPAGTVRVANTWYGDASETIRNLSVANGKLYFTVSHNSKGYVWQSDGTTVGTVEVSSTKTFSSLMTPVLDLAGLPIFQGRPTETEADPNQWWTIAGGAITRVESEPINAVGPTDQLYPKFAVAGSQLFFSATKDGDEELWVTNGTTAGTRRVKDINPGTTGSKPANMLAVGDEVYFAASDGTHGRELWRSDGTEAGTVLVADVEPGIASSWPYGLKVMGGKLYFHSERRTTGRELYSVDLPVE